MREFLIDDDFTVAKLFDPARHAYPRITRRAVPRRGVTPAYNVRAVGLPKAVASCDAAWPKHTIGAIEHATTIGHAG